MGFLGEEGGCHWLLRCSAVLGTLGPIVQMVIVRSTETCVTENGKIVRVILT